MSGRTASQELAEAYDQWLEVQRDLAAAMCGHEPRDQPGIWAEGYQHLIRLMASASLMYVEMDDPLNPCFYRDTDELRKLTLDNPDNHYLRARVSAGHAYRLSGRLGNSIYHGLTIERSHIAPGGHAVLAQVELEEFVHDADRRFELWLGGEPRASHWLALPPDTHSIFLRQTFADPARRELAELRIERLGMPEYRPASVAVQARRIREAAAFARWWGERALAIGRGFSGIRNALHTRGRAHRDPGGDRSIDYFGGGWELEPDDALVVSIRANSPFRYWGFQLANYWAESLDYRFLNVSLNSQQAITNTDGSWTVVLAHEDPGVPNWLTVAGHRQGVMALRWLKARDEPASPEVERVRRVDLRARLRSMSVR